ncbi:MAG: ATP-binding protein [Methanobacterium sp.]|uniref:ATP-binding protein n=1 Tax=Methanobacterium sp. TaxID=2164 RepID=UPI003D65282B|nr:ATP-binding protein [Methanobacterium sp.]
MNYYHDNKMEKIFEILKQPKTLEELKLSSTFVNNSILKIISSYGTIKTSRINEMTGIHWDILEGTLRKLEEDGLCAPVGGGFLFSSVDYTVTKKGHEKARRILEESPYIGMTPVSYEDYYKLMQAQLKGRYPLTIPGEVFEDTFKDVVGVSYAKEVLVESCTVGKGIFVYGPPGTGKTFIVSKASDLLPPLIIPKFIEFGGAVVQLFDPDFHKMSDEQPEDPRWVKIHAPFVLTGSELSLNKLETNYNPNKGLYETSPIIKANGGVLLIDDLGRQRDDHELILNRLIVPMENKKDVIYVRGIPVVVHSHFIPAFSTNLDISIMDEAHLRRAPLHIFLKAPPLDELIEVFKGNLDELKETYNEDTLERFIKVYMPAAEGGEGLDPSFAHARDIAQISQAVRINRQKDVIDVEVLDEALSKHILIELQRMNIDVSQVTKKIRSYRVQTSDVEATFKALNEYGPCGISYEDKAIILDVEETITPVQLATYLHKKGIVIKKIDLIAESERELKKSILQ